MDGLVIGRRVHYVLGLEDVDAIVENRRMVGNVYAGDVRTGDHVAADITAVLDPNTGRCSLKCQLNGPDTHWVPAAEFDDNPGDRDSLQERWHWVESA